MITSFSNENSFLSNFYPCKIEYEGIIYPTVEHAYQAAKTLNIGDRIDIANIDSPAMAKKRGKMLNLRSNWDNLKLDIMRELLQKKFSNSELKKLLLSTGEEELVEGNYWHDTFWGVCNGVGENHLGKLLMEIRELIVL